MCNDLYSLGKVSTVFPSHFATAEHGLLDCAYSAERGNR